MLKKSLLFTIGCLTIFCLKSTCGHKPDKQLKEKLFTPGSVKFQIIR